MAASEQVSAELLRLFVLGEVSLDGSLRPVAGVYATTIAAAAQSMGI